MKVKYIGVGGSYTDYPCYIDEKGKLYFDENDGSGGLNLYTGAFWEDAEERSEILGEPNIKVTEEIECDDPFVRHSREYDYRLLGRLKSDCEFFLGNGNGDEKILYYNSIDIHCDNMEEIWNSFSEEDKPEWLTLEQIKEYREKMNNRKEKGRVIRLDKKIYFLNDSSEDYIDAVIIAKTSTKEDIEAAISEVKASDEYTWEDILEALPDDCEIYDRWDNEIIYY